MTGGELMANVWVTIWRGGDAKEQRVSLDGVLLTGWKDAPANPLYVRRGKYVMRQLELNRTYVIGCRAEAPGQTFWNTVVGQNGGTLRDRVYSLPPDVNDNDQFTVR
jgi:hypothetical protein